MKIYPQLNIDYILEKANWHLSNHAYWLIKPDPSREICYEVGKFWLVDLHGDIILEGVDLSEFSGGFNLLKREGPFGFKHFITELCDGLLSKAGHDFELSDCDICESLRDSAGLPGNYLWEEDLDDSEPEI